MAFQKEIFLEVVGRGYDLQFYKSPDKAPLFITVKIICHIEGMPCFRPFSDTWQVPTQIICKKIMEVIFGDTRLLLLHMVHYKKGFATDYYLILRFINHSNYL